MYKTPYKNSEKRPWLKFQLSWMPPRPWYNLPALHGYALPAALRLSLTFGEDDVQYGCGASSSSLANPPVSLRTLEKNAAASRRSW